MTKKLLIISSSFLLLFLVTFLLGNKFLEHSLRSRIPALLEELSNESVVIGDLSFQNLSISSSRSLSWRNVNFRITPLNGQHFDSIAPYVASVGHLRLLTRDHSYRDQVIEAEGIIISTREGQAGFGSSAQQLRSVSLFGRLFSTGFSSDPAEPGESLRNHVMSLISYFSEGSVPVAIDFSGDVQMRISGRVHSLPVEVVADQETWHLQLAAETLEQLAQILGVQLSDSEIDLLKGNPIRTAIWGQVRHFIDSKVSELPSAKGRQSIPTETYRYVLLGYHLAEALGVDFAEAYAKANTSENSLRSKSELDSDRLNLALGIRYAKQGISADNILDLAIKEGSVASKRTTWSVR